MALRAGHGNGAGKPRVEMLPPGEQPKPVPSAKSLDKQVRLDHDAFQSIDDARRKP
jgi:hypothetical protein